MRIKCNRCSRETTIQFPEYHTQDFYCMCGHVLMEVRKGKPVEKNLLEPMFSGELKVGKRKSKATAKRGKINKEQAEARAIILKDKPKSVEGESNIYKSPFKEQFKQQVEMYLSQGYKQNLAIEKAHVDISKL